MTKSIVDEVSVPVLSPAGLMAGIKTRWRAKLLWASGIAGAVGLATLLLPDVYTATAMVLVPAHAENTTAALLGQMAGPLSDIAGRGLGLKSNSDLYVALLGSRTVSDRMVEKFQLVNAYRTRTVTEARQALEHNRQFTVTKDLVMRIDVDDSNPGRAANIANALISESAALNVELTQQESTRRYEFYEKELRSEKVALGQAEDQFVTTQSKRGLILPDAQTQWAIATAAQLRAKIAASKVAIGRLGLSSTDANPDVIQAKMELGGLQQELFKIEKDPGSSNGPVSTLPQVPAAALTYARSLREMKYHETLYQLFAKQVEMARMEAADAAAGFRIVDKAVAPEKPSGPPRLLLSLSTLVVCLFTLVIASSLRRKEKLGDDEWR